MEDEESVGVYNEGTLIPMTSEEDIKPRILYMNHVVKFSQIIHMWPNTNNVNRFRYHFVVWFIAINCTIMVILFSIQIKTEYKNMDFISELVDFDTVLISGTFRYCYVYLRGNQYAELVHLIHTKFIERSFIRTRNRTTLDNFYKAAKRMILIYCAAIVFWILQVCSVPILGYAWTVYTRTNDSEPIPYPIVKKVYTPFDVNVQPQNFLFYTFQVVWFFVFGWIYMVVDSFWYLVIILTIGQFVLIKDSINAITRLLEHETTAISVVERKEVLEVEKCLERCIKHHQFLRQFVRMIDDISNPVFLVDSLHAVISIGFILLDVIIALNVNDWNKLLYSMEYFITSVIHMFLFDWLGNKLAQKEEELADAVYQIPWQQCPIQKTHLLLISIQSRRPYRLTGGRMYKLSLEFFTSTMKAVFSYFTFLFQLRNK